MYFSLPSGTRSKQTPATKRAEKLGSSMSTSMTKSFSNRQRVHVQCHFDRKTR